MRNFHVKKNDYRNWRPIINIDMVWSLLTEEQRKLAASKKDVAPIIDVTKKVRVCSVQGRMQSSVQ